MISLLDCTLRDGGYVNNWEFDTNTSRDIVNRLYDSGVRYIELGILGTDAQAGRQTKFNNFNEIVPLLADRKQDCHYAVMFTQENAGNFEFPTSSVDTPDCIRIAYFKKQWKDAFKMAQELQQKGYQVFLQAMATFMYSHTELGEMIDAVNQIEPTAFYIVDSFSTMMPTDVRNFNNQVRQKLSDKVAVGFHAHNNIQMGYANVQEFIRCNENYDIFVDGSISGMGRGAGNVPIELVMDFVNLTTGTKYDSSKVIQIYQDCLSGIFRKCGWGYSMPYYLTAKHKVNSVYGWYFTSHGIDNLSMLERAICEIPIDCISALNRVVADEIIERIKNGK